MKMMYKNGVTKIQVALIAIIVIVGGALGLYFSLTSFAAPKAPEVIKLGGVYPLTGPAAEAGIATLQGVKLAIDEWNEKGGIFLREYGRTLKIEYIAEDSASKPEQGVAAAEKLITKDKVHMIAGGEAFHSSVTLAIMELAPKYNIPIVSLQPVSLEITKKVLSDPDKYKYFFKLDWNSSVYAEAFFYYITYLVENNYFKPKTKTLAFIVEDTDYGRANAEESRRLFEGAGWKTVAYEKVSLGHTDFYAILTKIKGLNPDVLMTCFTALSSGVALVKQFHEIGLTSLHFAIYYPIKVEFLQQAGKAADYLIWEPLIFYPGVNPGHGELARKIKEKYGVEATGDHLYGYSMMEFILSVIEKAGSLDPEKIRLAFLETEAETLMGKFKINPKNHESIASPKGGYIYPVIAQIIDGKNYPLFPLDRATREYVQQPWIKG
jgi:branched-chain amino acid transport system substrate-binding protein